MSIPSSLLAYSKAGSDLEWTIPIKGPAWSVYGSPSYTTGRFGNATTHDDYTKYVDITCTSEFSMDQGCIEMWIYLPGYSITDGVASDGNSHTFWTWETNFPISGYVCDWRIEPGYGPLIEWSGDYWYQTWFFSSGFTIAADTWTHIAFSWDVNNATKKKIVFIDESEIASDNTSWTAGNDMTGKRACLGTYNDWVGPIYPWVPGLYLLDNPKWWDYQKTDFSDKDTEGYASIKSLINRFNLQSTSGVLFHDF